MKFYCWMDWLGEVHIDKEEQDWDYNPHIRFYVGTIEAKDIEEAEQKAINKMQEKFKGGK